MGTQEVMSREESKEEPVKSYFKNLTLLNKFGSTGSVEAADGAFYIGDVGENGVRTGLGHLEIPNGSTYDGSFQKGLPNGIGVMRFPDSSRYEGEFMQGWFHGHGMFTTLDGTKFEGEFRGGRLWGKGLLSYHDGSPGTEGYFQDVRFSRECSAVDDIKKARKVATMAKTFCETTC